MHVVDQHVFRNQESRFDPQNSLATATFLIERTNDFLQHLVSPLYNSIINVLSIEHIASQHPTLWCNIQQSLKQDSVCLRITFHEALLGVYIVRAAGEYPCLDVRIVLEDGVQALMEAVEHVDGFIAAYAGIEACVQVSRAGAGSGVLEALEHGIADVDCGYWGGVREVGLCCAGVVDWGRLSRCQSKAEL